MSRFPAILLSLSVSLVSWRGLVLADDLPLHRSGGRPTATGDGPAPGTLVATVSGAGTLEYAPRHVPATEKERDAFRPRHRELFRDFVSREGTLEMLRTRWIGNGADRRSGELIELRVEVRHSPRGEGPGIQRTLTLRRRNDGRGGFAWDLYVTP